MLFTHLLLPEQAHLEELLKNANTLAKSWEQQCNNSDNQHYQTTSGSKKKKAHLVVSYIQGLSESFKKVCGKHGVKVY